jgi:hypothetical protein
LDAPISSIALIKKFSNSNPIFSTPEKSYAYINTTDQLFTTRTFMSGICLPRIQELLSINLYKYREPVRVNQFAVPT